MSEVLKQKIRRDLSRWSRKLLICVGLESIGKQLVGQENWSHLYPVDRDWEQDKSSVSDFDPTTKTTTELTPYFSSLEEEDIIPTLATSTSRDIEMPMSHLDPSASAAEEDPDDDGQSEDRNDNYENIFRLLPYWYFFNRAFGNSNDDVPRQTFDLTNTNYPLMEALDAQQLNALLLLHSFKQHELHQLQLQQAKSVETSAAPSISHSHVQKIPPFQFQDPHEIANSLIRHHDNNDASAEYTHYLYGASSGLSHSPSHEIEEQPLDLTRKNRVVVADSHEEESSSRLISAEVSSSNGKDLTPIGPYNKVILKSNARSGRGYTTEELQAALNDIQSGKLGTRRAAVIYGIPRSTLRNKVYKLSKDQLRTLRQVEKKTTPDDTKTQEDSSQNILCRNSVRLTQGRPIIGSEKGSAFTPVQKRSSTSVQVNSAEIPGRISEDEKSEEEISYEKKALKEWLQSKLLRQRLKNLSPDNNQYLCNESLEHHKSNVRTMSESSDCSDEAQHFHLSTPDEGRRGTKRRFYNGESQNIAQATTTPASTVTSLMDNVPDWGTLHVNDDDCSMEDSDPDFSNGTKKKNRQKYFDAGQDQMSVASGFISDADGKKRRPKRGKYRNYDRDALVKAVKAVQNGEMSVHRAGSYYGVPHSTLEYKVKERHLLRRPKRKESETSKAIQKSSPESSLSGGGGSDPGPQIPRVELSPVASATRETLTRFLSIGSHRNRGSSPDSVSNIRCQRSSNESHTEFGKDVCIERPMHIESFQVNTLNRRSFDNSSLLDLTKKS